MDDSVLNVYDGGENPMDGDQVEVVRPHELCLLIGTICTIIEIRHTGGMVYLKVAPDEYDLNYYPRRFKLLSRKGSE